MPFGSYSRSFLASPSFGSVASSDGAPFEPEQGRQWEAGVKVDWGGTIMTTLAAYDLERSNVPVADPEDPAFRIVTGLQRSRGVELLGSWEPSPHFAVFGSYAYTDARLVRDTSLPEGTRLDNVPYHSGRVWLRGSIEVGEGHTVGAQLGSTFSDDVAASLTSDVTVPGYTVLDGGAFFESGAFLLQLAVQNVSDRYYFLRAAFGGGGVVPGDARRIIGVARWRR